MCLGCLKIEFLNKILRTDHQALTVLLSPKGKDCAGMRIARWAA